jgi:DNA helicase-2/ATP-dependent DNA helicase PcrA
VSEPALQLSPEQERVVSHRGGDLQVIACAGSGKTESIARRIAALIADGAEPASIVAFTFTERAAAELKERIGRRVREQMGPEFLDRLGPMFVGTIHGYCFRLLLDHVPRYGSYDVLDEHRHAGLLSREHQRLGLARLGVRHWAPIRDFARTADVIANELIEPRQLDGTPLGDVYRAYRETLDRYHFLTFGLLIAAAVEALEDAATFHRVHDPLRYLVVDEYQDINQAQERLIQRLAAPPVELCVVGDDDQAIYQWRGSDVRNILDFTRRRPGATTVPLTDNRRCRPAIVERADAFARTIPGRLAKTMRAVRPPASPAVVAWLAETEDEEAERIAETIERLHAAGYRYRDVAVLYRSVRTSAPPLIEACQRRSIPFACAGRTGLFLQPDIALFGEIFAWFVDGDWKDERFGASRRADLDRIVAGLERQFGGGTPVPGLRKYLEDWKAFQLRATRPVSLVGDFYRLLWRLGAYTIDLDTPEGSARFGAFARFSRVLADFEHVNRRGRYVDENGRRTFRAGRDRGKPYFQSLHNYLLHYALDAYEDFEGEHAVDLDAVDILTVHQSKGLEWPVVFMPALVDGRFPSRWAGRPQDWLLPEAVFPAEVRRRYEGSEAEERRLFYVALARARDCAYLSHFERRTNRFRPSPFLRDVAGRSIPRLEELPLPPPPARDRDGEPPPLEIPFSDVALFEECGHRYRLGAGLGFQQELAVELGYGKAIHHVLRQVAETTRASGVIPDAEVLRALVDTEFYLPFADAPAFDRMYRAATRLVEGYVTHWASDLRRVWAIERPFEVYLDDGTITGRADIILDEEEGRIGSLALVDYKVASDPERDERYRLQLAVYAAAGRGEGLQVDAAYLHELRDGLRSGVDIEPGTIAVAVGTVARSVAAIRRGAYPPRPEAARCRACDFRRICAHRAGPPDD